MSEPTVSPDAKPKLRKTKRSDLPWTMTVPSQELIGLEYVMSFSSWQCAWDWIDVEIYGKRRSGGAAMIGRDGSLSR